MGAMILEPKKIKFLKIVNQPQSNWLYSYI